MKQTIEFIHVTNCGDSLYYVDGRKREVLTKKSKKYIIDTREGESDSFTIQYADKTTGDMVYNTYLYNQIQ